MKLRGCALAAAVTVVLLADGAARGAKEAPKDVSSIVRYVRAERGTAWGKPVLRVIVSPVKGGSTKALVAPKQDPKSNTFDPDPKVVSVVKVLKKGDLLNVTTGRFKGVILIRRISRFLVQPGEEEPNGFLFVRAEEEDIARETYLVVTLQKFGQETKVVVPNKKNEAGEMAPDEALAARLTAFKIGEVVEVEAQKKGRLRTLKSIRKYAPPVVCEFVKLVEETVDEVEHVGIEVKIGGEPQTLFVPNVQRGKRNFPDSRLRSAARRLKPGDWIEAKIRTEGDRKLVTRITKTRKKDVEKGGSDQEKKNPA